MPEIPKWMLTKASEVGVRYVGVEMLTGENSSRRSQNDFHKRNRNAKTARIERQGLGKLSNCQSVRQFGPIQKTIWRNIESRVRFFKSYAWFEAIKGTTLLALQWEFS